MTNAGSILVVDDEATIRQTLASILQQERFEVTTAQSGEQALAFLETSEFDAIYLDIRMPEMSGLEVLEKVHASHPDIPVILFTAQPDLHSAVEALRRGAADYLSKPLKPAALIAKTHSILVHRRRERRKREIKAQIEGLQDELKSIEKEDLEHSAQKQAPPAKDRFLKRGNLVLDLHARRLIIEEELMNLRPTSFDYLLVLARHAPEVVDYQTLVAEALGYQAEAREAQRLVKWHIHDIRRAIETDVHQPIYLLNERGVGYRLVAE